MQQRVATEEDFGRTFSLSHNSTKHVSKFSTFSQFSQFHEVAFGKSRIRYFLENLDFNVFPVTRLHSKRLIREIHLYLYVRNTFLYLSGIHFYICLKQISIFEESPDLDIFAVTRPRCCIWRRVKSVKLETRTKTLRDLTDAALSNYTFSPRNPMKIC